MSNSLIDCYRAIEASSLQMLEAARSQDWDTVVHFEGVCAVLIEQLRNQARLFELNPADKAEKSRIMLRILGNDALVRDLAEPWLTHVEARLGSHGRVLH